MLILAAVCFYFMTLACTVGVVGEIVAGHWAGAVAGCVPVSGFLFCSVILTGVVVKDSSK